MDGETYVMHVTARYNYNCNHFCAFVHVKSTTFKHIYSETWFDGLRNGHVIQNECSKRFADFQRRFMVINGFYKFASNNFYLFFCNEILLSRTFRQMISSKKWECVNSGLSISRAYIGVYCCLSKFKWTTGVIQNQVINQSLSCGGKWRNFSNKLR